ncbi:MAG TPA: hypothetical protein VMC83_23900 [Streptosporangiaceae bacterium]|nr:hypothetical protein [Streptosporangiaceae bacterium]
MRQQAPEHSSCALLSRLRTIMEGGAADTADDRYRHLLGAFRATEPAELNGLLAIPEQLSMASDYVHAVLDDLDERRPGATTELHGVLGSAVGPILVGWPE